MTNIINKRYTFDKLDYIRSNSHIISLILFVIIASLLSKGIFIRPSNLGSVLLRASILGMLAIGQTLVILTAGIDLSIAANLGLCVAVMSLSLRMGLPPTVVMLIGVAATSIIGLVNGLLCANTKVPPFIITLSTMMIIKSIGLAAIGTHATVFYEIQDLFNAIMDWIPIFGASSFPAIIWIITSTTLFLLLRYTRFGYNLYATGGTEKAAYYSGVNVKGVKITVYTLSGMLAGLATILYVYRLGGTNPVAGGQYQLESIAATIIGGTSLFGGEGKLSGTFVGAIVMTMLVNLMNIMSVNPYIQKTIMGVIFISYVYFLDIVRNLRIGNIRK